MTETTTTEIKKIVHLRLREYDRTDATTIECVHNDEYQTPWRGTTERTVRALLAAGDYSKGDEDRVVEVYLCTASGGEKYHARYTAPQIRRFRVR